MKLPSRARGVHGVSAVGTFEGFKHLVLTQVEICGATRTFHDVYAICFYAI